MPSSGRLSILVPVKAFTRAKARLAPTLSPDERATLAREMATAVVRAATGLDVWVVCDDDDVAAWARDEGAQVSWQPGAGLNAAVGAASTARFESGAGRVAVVHGDLPLVRSLGWLADETDRLVLVPDRHGTGTNVISTPTKEFAYAYGPGSFARHIAEARRIGFDAQIVHDAALGWDVDEPEDLSALEVKTTMAGRWAAPASRPSRRDADQR